MKLATTRILYDYWNTIRGTRLAPMRFEIEPSDIAGVLSETFILERGEPGRYPFRLAGTRMCEQLGRELRGVDFTSLAGIAKPVLAKALEAVTDEGGAAVLEFEGEAADGRTAGFEAVVLPLLHPAREVTRYLGAFAAIDPPEWLSAEPVGPIGLIAHDIIWPEGRVLGLGIDDDRQRPFASELAGARVVRADRRQFRILDGGRKE